MKRNKLEKITGNPWHLMIYSLYNCGMRPARIVEILQELRGQDIRTQTVYVTVKKIQKEIDAFDVDEAGECQEWRSMLTNRVVARIENAGVQTSEQLLQVDPGNQKALWI